MRNREALILVSNIHTGEYYDVIQKSKKKIIASR